jgi:hypothetical protein
MLGWVEISPGDFKKHEFRLEHLKPQRGNGNIKRAREISIQVEAAFFEVRFLFFNGAVGIVFGWP